MGITRGLVLAVALAACGGPQFKHAGAPIAGAGGPIEVERVTLRWSNVYLLHRGDAAVLVDSGSPVDRDKLAAALAARGFDAPKLKAAVITHVHADHAGCAAWLKGRGVAVLIGAGDKDVAARGRNTPLRPTSLMGAALATVFMFPFEPFAPDVAVDAEMDLGAYGFPELRVVPAAGHTPGSLVVTAPGVAFVGDMVKGGEVFTRTPTEHLYMADRLADHRALAGVVAGGANTLYLGHSGPLAAADVRSWLTGADDRGHDNAVSFEFDARAERAEGTSGATAGLRFRYAIGRTGYYAGADLRAGYLDRGDFEFDAHPVGFAVRGAGGAFVAVTAGAGIGGLRATSATHAIAELDAELPAGPVRLLARAGLGWRLTGPDYAGDAGPADELFATAGIRLGSDRRWGEFVAGKGPFLAFSLRDLGGARIYGIALGLDVFAGR